MYDMNHDHRTR